VYSPNILNNVKIVGYQEQIKRLRQILLIKAKLNLRQKYNQEKKKYCSLLRYKIMRLKGRRINLQYQMLLQVLGEKRRERRKFLRIKNSLVNLVLIDCFLECFKL